MAILLITILTIIVFILGAICIQRGTRISSLKKEVRFLESNLQLLTAKEKGLNQDIKEANSLKELSSKL